MNTKEVYSTLASQAPKGYRISELTKFSYPVRKVRINAVVNKAPDKNLVKVYAVLLRCIENNLNEKQQLFDFLGVPQTDEFILHELFALREKGLLDLVSDKWYVTEQGKAFIENNSLLRFEECEVFEFLIDGLTGKIFSSLNTECKKDREKKYIKQEPNVATKLGDLLKDQFQELCEVYTQDTKGEGLLIDYDREKVLFDNNNLWIDYWFVGYMPEDETGEPYYEVHDVETLGKKESLTKQFNAEYWRYEPYLHEPEKTSEEILEELENLLKEEVAVHDTFTKGSQSLNSRDVDESDDSLGENWLTDNRTDPKRAVIELSTKAVKWLVPKVPNDRVREGFSHDLFIHNGVKTETGNGLDENNVMDMDYFKNKVLPAIRRAYSDARYFHADVVYCVATAAYRSAKNRQEILDLIKKETKLNVCVLSKKQEAEYTLWGYLNSSKDGGIKEVPNILLIDQGGGSTEVTFFQNQEMTFCHSFDIGTTGLKNDFFSKTGAVNERLKEIDEKYERKLREELSEFTIPDFSGDTLCISVGTAVTAAFGNGALQNRKVHERVLNPDTIKESIDKRTEEFGKMSMEQLRYEAMQKGESAQTLEKRLSSRLGLPVIQNILKVFNMNELRISGTGLWYGVFYKTFWGIE